MKPVIRTSVMFAMFAAAVAMIFVTGLMVANKYYWGAVPPFIFVVLLTAAGIRDLLLLKKGE